MYPKRQGISKSMKSLSSIKTSLTDSEKIMYCHNVLTAGGGCNKAGELSGWVMRCGLCPIPNSESEGCAPMKVVARAKQYLIDYEQDEDNVI
jgi:hypothetical protein